MKTLKFVRWGDLNPVNHKKAFKKDSYHSPPLKKGIYAFIPTKIEMFLVGWKLYKDVLDDAGEFLKTEKTNIKKREFSHSGKIWIHIFFNDPEIRYYRRVKSWYETDTDSLERILKLEFKRLSKDVHKDGMLGGMCFKNDIRFYSKDHFEIFIERVKC
jgi:hypothetical protein